jgi:hypothetical protein
MLSWQAPEEKRYGRNSGGDFAWFGSLFFALYYAATGQKHYIMTSCSYSHS